jgi:phosphohistidine phosphatase SixA
MAVFVIRHGSAGKRNGADPLDSERDLDSRGRRQAEQIAAELAVEDISTILSSPYPRCVQTVEPLAETLGLEIEQCDFLAEGSELGGILERIERNGDRGMAICSHGDLIPDLVTTMQRRGTELGDIVGFAKASVWTMTDWRGHCFASATYRKVRPRMDTAATDQHL